MRPRRCRRASTTFSLRILEVSHRSGGGLSEILVTPRVGPLLQMATRKVSELTGPIQNFVSLLGWKRPDYLD